MGNHGVPDVYEQARGQLDASFSRVVAGYFKLSFSAKNLLNPDVYYKMGDADYLRYKIGEVFLARRKLQSVAYSGSAVSRRKPSAKRTFVN